MGTVLYLFHFVLGLNLPFDWKNAAFFHFRQTSKSIQLSLFVQHKISQNHKKFCLKKKKDRFSPIIDIDSKLITYFPIDPSYLTKPYSLVSYLHW